MTISKFLVGTITSLVMSSVLASGGVQLDRSRILIKDGKTAASYAIQNHYDSPLLARAIITNFDGTPSTAFAVSPSLFQIKPKATFQSQVVQLEKLPNDRESVFWLTVKTVLASDKKEEKSPNAVEFAIAQSIKLFYRPKGISDNCESAVKKIEWYKTSKGLKAKNPSAVSVSLVKVKSGTTESSIGDTLLPFEEKEWNAVINSNAETVFTFVDEYGNFLEKKINFK